MIKMPLTGSSSKEPKAKNIRRDVDDIDQGQSSFLKQRLLIFVFSGILLAICFVFLIVGIVFLTGKFYAFSFTAFSTTLVAGLFIAFGVVIIAMVVLNIYLVMAGRDNLVGFTTIIKLILLTVLFAIGKLFFFKIFQILWNILLLLFKQNKTNLLTGIWGLSVSTGQTFVQTVRQGMADTLQLYQFDNPDIYQTRKFDWLQRTFNCCGIDSYQDWKGLGWYIILELINLSPRSK